MLTKLLRRRALAAAALLVSLAAITASATAIGPKEAKASAALLEEEMRLLPQARISAAADRIDQLVSTSKFDGFAGLMLDDAKNAVRLYWKGALPQAVSNLIATIRAGGDAVEVRAARFSLAELDAESRRITSLRKADIGVQVTSAGPLEDYSGLDVTVARAEELSAARSAIASKYPIQLDVMPEVLETVFGRWDDTPPFWGGGAIFAGTSGCSTGFALKTTTGQKRMLTARHCGLNTDFYTPTGSYVGHSGSTGNSSKDANALSGTDYGATIFIGAWNSATSRDVGSSGNPTDEKQVFVSGAFSGYHVVRVKEVNKYLSINGVSRGPASGLLTRKAMDRLDKVTAADRSAITMPPSPRSSRVG